MAKVIIPQSVSKKASDDCIRVIRPSVERDITVEFEKIKRQMIREFLNHPVTREISTGVDSPNYSKTLPYGNLYSFIGFYADEPDPTDGILALLEESLISFYTRKRGSFVASITIPSAKQIFDGTPMPWAAGRSWAKGIESGISGLGYYLPLIEVGRSEGARQNKTKIGSGKFKNTTYISALINKYIKVFSSIQGVRVIGGIKKI
jgi:hypothetical protein